MKILIATLGAAAFCLATAGWASEASFVPIPAYTAEAQAVREAARLQKEGDSLQEEGRPKEAREKWLAAVEAYRRSGYRPGEVEVLLRLGTSYRMAAAFDPEKKTLMQELMVQGLRVGVEHLVDIAQKVEPKERGPFEEADAQFRQGADLVLAGDCTKALEFFTEARRLYSEAGSAAGELRSLGARMDCMSKSGDIVGLMLGFAELSPVAEKVKSIAGVLMLPMLHLKAVREDELGNSEGAEALYRGVLQVYEVAQDVKNAALAALDLGGLLAKRGQFDEAEKLFQRARDQFASLPDLEDRRNEAAALQNLADLYRAAGRLKESVSTYRLAYEKWITLDESTRGAAALRTLGSILRAQGDEVSSAAVLDEAKKLEGGIAGEVEAPIGDSVVVPQETQILQPVEAYEPKPSAGSRPVLHGDGFVGTPFATQSLRSRAQREATILLGEGDRLLEGERLKEAREKWLASSEAYKRAANGLGAAQAYGRLADSYMSEMLVDQRKRLLALDYYIQSVSAAAEYHDDLLRESHASVDDESVGEADSAFERASELVALGKCKDASGLIRQAGEKYRNGSSHLGEAKSLMLKARCQVAEGNDVGAFLTVLEIKPIFDGLSFGTPLGELELRGYELYEQGRLWESLGLLQEVLCRYEEKRDFAGIAGALINLGAVQSSLGDFAGAESSLQRALPLIQAVGEDSLSNEATARHNLGLLFLGIGQGREAAVELRDAVYLRRKAGEPELEVVSLSALGLAFREQGDYPTALDVLGEAERLQAQLTPNKEIEGDLLTNRGSVYLKQGRYQDALDLFRRAMAVYNQASKPWKEWQALANIASAEISLGRFADAMRTYEEIESKGALLGDVGAAIRFKSDVNRAGMLIQSGHYQWGVKILLNILPKVAERGELSDEATIRNTLGIAYREIGDLENADIHLRLAAEAFRRLGNPEGLASAIMNRGQLLIQAQNFNEAGAELARALEMWAKVGNPVMEDRVRINLGLLSAVDGISEQELQDLREIKTRLRTLGLYKDALKVLILEGAFNLQHGRLAAALENSAQIIEVAAQIQDPAGKFSGLGLALAAHFFQGNHEAALADLEGAMAVVDSWQAGLTASELKGTFLDRFFDVYAAAVVLNAMAGRAAEAFQFAEQARARSFLDKLGNQRIKLRSGVDSELIRAEGDLRSQISKLQESIEKEREKPISDQRQDVLASLGSLLEEARRRYSTLLVRLKLENPELAALVAVDVIGLEQAQQALDQETTMIQYFIPALSQGGGDANVLAWVVEKDHYVLIPLPVNTDKLVKQVELFRSQIEAQQDASSLALELYHGLFAPLAPHIRNRNVIVVPHGVLHFLPFAALWDAERRNHLGKFYTLSYAPSATVLKLVRRRQVLPQEPILIAGNPDGTLSHATGEAQAVARPYSVEPLLGREATESAILSRAPEAGILHLAAHADLNPINPLFTSIRLAPDGEHDGSLEMHEVYGLDLSKTGLVVLSACNTQMGRLSRGDEIEGLTRAFLYAGTPAVVSSLWKVDDESTALFMKRFYTHLRKGKGRAEALQSAQAETRRRFPHPYHWAAFVLTGDGR